MFILLMIYVVSIITAIIGIMLSFYIDNKNNRLITLNAGELIVFILSTFMPVINTMFAIWCIGNVISNSEWLEKEIYRNKK